MKTQWQESDQCNLVTVISGGKVSLCFWLTRISQYLAIFSWQESGDEGLVHYFSPSRIKGVNCGKTVWASREMTLIETLLSSSAVAPQYLFRMPSVSPLR